MDMFGRQKLAQLSEVLEEMLKALEAMNAQQERIEQKLDVLVKNLWETRKPQPVAHQALVPIVAKPQVTKPSLTEVKKNDKSK